MIPAISTEVIKAREHANEVVRKKKHHMHAPLLPDRTRGCIPQRRGVETTPRALRSRSFRHGRQYQCHRRSGSGRPVALQRPRTLTHLHVKVKVKVKLKTNQDRMEMEIKMSCTQTVTNTTPPSPQIPFTIDINSPTSAAASLPSLTSITTRMTPTTISVIEAALSNDTISPLLHRPRPRISITCTIYPTA